MSKIEDVENWQPARLFPTTGIGGVAEQERRATSALLAVVGSVHEFGRAIASAAGAPSGRIETFTEVRLKLDDRTVIPDGLIRVTRGQRVWICLVEVKTNGNSLEAKQLEDYLDVAKLYKFDALLTISNEIPTVVDAHPTFVAKKKVSKAKMVHLPWTSVLTVAAVEKEHKGVKDPDQAWILGELIRYLRTPNAGTLPAVDMGESWVSVRDSARLGTLTKSERGAESVARHWDRLVRYSALELTQKLGADVECQMTPAERNDPALRVANLVSALIATGQLESQLKIPKVAAPITIVANLRTQQVSASMQVSAPKEGKSRTGVNWLLRQLKAAPPSLVVRSRAPRSSTWLSETLAAVTADPDLLVAQAKVPAATFALVLTQPMGQKRGNVQGGFPTSVQSVVNVFYETVAQNVRPWVAAAPKMHSAPTLEPVASVTGSKDDSTRQSSPIEAGLRSA